MKLLNKILFATDFSKASDAALKGVLPIAKAYESEIMLLHAIEHLPDVPQAYSRVNRALQKKLRELQARVQAMGVACPHEPILQIGKPSQMIRAIADRYDVNLIVLGAGNKTAEDRFFLGSTAEKVIRTAAQPVWTDLPGAHDGIIERILCAVDYSESSCFALTNAIYLARKLKAKLTILHVTPRELHYPHLPELAYPVTDVGMLTSEQRTLPPYIEKEVEAAGAEFIEMAAEEKREQDRFTLNQFVSEFDLADVEWEAHLCEGKAADTILAEARHGKAQLLVLGSAGRTGLSRLIMGNTAEKIVRKSPCSLLTVKSTDLLHVRLDPAVSTGARFRQARRLLEAGFLLQAVTELETCVAQDKHFAEAYEVIAQASDRLGDTGKANEMRKRAAEARQWNWDHQLQVHHPAQRT